MSSHDHHHEHGGDRHDHGSTSRGRLLWALVLTASFLVVEVVAGFASGSLALLSDAGHMLTDAGALGLALWAQALGARPRSGSKTFGYRRAEILAAAANGIVLGIMALAVIVEAVRRFVSPPSHVHGAAVMIVAGIGLGINLLAARILSPPGTVDLNMRAAAAHVMADAAGSVAAIVAGTLIWLFGWTIADPITSILISGLILYGAWRLLRDATHVLMEGVRGVVDLAALEEVVRCVPGVQGFHDLHVWSITGDSPVVTVHVELARGHHGVEVARDVAARLERLIGRAHVTVQPEAAGPGDELFPPDKLVRTP